ncbi:MAG: TIGR04076 family protein [Promethearchaeota archaeon]|nr:MAG: TIGR04076 family protein [Candidatus Lokiarchaeota archaeon]
MQNKVKITVVKQFQPKDIFGYDYTLVSGKTVTKCSLKEGKEFISDGTGNMPEGFCPHAWNSIFKNVHLLTWGGGYSETIGEGISFGVCPDGLRPVIFKLEKFD